MKVLVTGDWQIESRPSCDRLDENGRSIRFYENKATIMRMLDDAAAKGCTGMVHLGDLTEERNPDSATLEMAGDAFGYALKLGWEVFAIAGNHDGAFFDVSSSSFAAFSKLNDKFHVFHKPTYTRIGESWCLFVPYLHRKSAADVMGMALDTLLPGQRAPYVFAHYAYAGVTIGAKNLVLPGDNLDSSFLTKAMADVAFFGHIHKQQVVQGNCPVVFPGSPFICDFGERKDPKGYAILDTETGKWELFQIPPTRQWIQVDWHELGTAKRGAPKFGPMDIVKIVGEYSPGESPQDALKGAIAAGGAQEPFYKTFGTTRTIQATKRGVVSGDSGLQKALADYIADRWPDHKKASLALEAALGALKASSPAAFDKSVALTEVRMTDFLSHPKAEVIFKAGEPLLICGENGLGKTNLIEAVLFALTGQVSKGLKMASLVRQGASKTVVELLMAGEKGEYRIRRTVSLNSKGAATHKVDVEIAGAKGGWTSLADGGVADTQAALGRLIGATFLSMRAVNFQFQRDPNPFIGAEPSERKAILAEILGLDSLGRAFKVLNEDRLVKMRVKETALAVAQEAEMALDPAKVQAFRDNLKAYEAKKPAAEATLKSGKASLEAAVAEAGAIGSERNSLQGVIDSLEGQANGAIDLRKAKEAAEATYAKSRAERGAVYLAAKARVEAKAIQAIQVNDLTFSHKAAIIRLEALSKKDPLAASMEGLDALEAASAKAAKLAVDARLLAKEEVRYLADAEGAESAAKKIIRDLEAEIGMLLEQDQKTCSKCGQPIDSTHLEAEMTKLNAEMIKAKAHLVECVAAKEKSKLARFEADAKEKAAQEEADRAATAAFNAVAQAKSAAESALSVAKHDVVVAEMALKGAMDAATELKQATEERDAALKAGNQAKEAHDKAVADLDAQIAKADAQAAEAKAKAEAAKTSLASIDTRLLRAQEEVTNIRARVDHSESELEFIVFNINGAKAGIETAKEYEARAKAKKDEFEAAALAWEIAEMASQALDPKAGLPVHLIDEKLPALSDAVNSYLAEFGDQEFTIGFSTRKDDGKETLDVLVDNGCEPRLDVAAYSGGQLDRIEFCLRMALGDLAEEMRDVRLGFVMMDEPGTHLDADKKGALMRMIVERTADGRCPIAVIVSHDPKLMSAIPSRLIVTRNGITRA